MVHSCKVIILFGLLLLIIAIPYFDVCAVANNPLLIYDQTILDTNSLSCQTENLGTSIDYQ